MSYVTGKFSISEVNAAIAIPPRLLADDGRVFQIIDWAAKAKLTDNVEITVTMLVNRERQAN